MRVTNNSIIPLVVAGLGILVITTIPIWVPCLLGVKSRKYECGIQVNSNGLRFYCNSQH